MDFPNLKKYAAFILDQCLDDFVRINIQRVKEVELPLFKLFSSFTEEQLFAYSYNSIQPFLQSLANGTALEAVQENINKWKANQLPNVPRNTIDVKDMAFSPHTRKYAFIKLLKLYTTDILVYESVVQDLDIFYSCQQEIGLQAFIDIQHELLINEKEFIATILDNTADGISAYDTEGKLTIWNKALESRTGIPRNQALGQNLFSLFSQYKDTENLEAMERVLKGEKVSLRDMLLKDRPGYYEADMTPLLNSQGAVMGGVTFSRDITEQKIAEDKLKKSQAIMAQAQSIAHFGSWEWENTSRIVTWSDEMYRIFGYEPQSVEINNEWLGQHIHPEDIGKLEKIFKHTALENGNFEITTRIFRKDKSIRITQTKALVIYGSDGKPARVYGASQDVTEEKEMQLLIQGVLNGSLAGLLYFKAVRGDKGNITDFEYILVNDAAYQYLQMSENLVGRTLLTAYPGIQQTILFESFQQVILTGEPFSKEIYYGKDNFKNWFKIHAVKHGDGLVVSFEDTSATKDAERKIQQEKEFSDSLISNSIDGIVSLDAELRYTAWNPVMERKTGKSAEQVLGRHVLEVFPGSGNTEIVQAMNAALQGTPTNLYDRKLAGGKGYCDSYIFPLYNKEKLITGVMTITHDISERKINELRQAEARQEISRKNQELASALEELGHYKDHLVHLNNRLEEKVKERTEELMKSENQLRLIADALPVLVSYIDADHRYRFTNKTYTEWFKKPVSEIQGRTMRETVGEEVYKRALPYIQQVLQGKHVHYESEMPYLEKGNLFVSISYVPHIEQGQTIGFYAIVIDVTERVKNEKALQVAFKEMEQKNQELSKINELLDNFVYMAAHDLKSPVANMKLLTGMLIRTDNSVHPELFSAIVESVNRLDNTINGLVEVIEIQSVHDIPVKELDFGAQFSSVSQEHAEEINSTKSVIETDFSQRGTIRYVEAYLQSIIKNLLTNAIKYRSNSRNLHLQIRTENADGFVLLTFCDNGMGMNLNKYKQHLFKPFTRFTNKASGKGLGLHLIKSMVEKNGGKVLVESEPEIGTTFYLYLKAY